MKAQSKNRKSPTCSRCRLHGEKDIRVLQHKCPFKDCSCSECLVVKKRPNIYRAQKNLDKSDENSNEVSSPGSGSTGSSRCLGSPQIPMHPGNMGDSNEPSLQNPWSTNHQPPPPPQQQAPPQIQQQLQHQQPPVPPPSSLVVPPPPPPHQMPPSSINSILPNKNIGYSNIKNFHELCLTFPEHSPPYLQTIFEQCGNDYEKTIDKILMSGYSESSASNNDYQQQQQQSLSNDPNYLNNHNNTNSTNNNNMNHNNNTNSTATNNHNSSNHNHNHNTNHNNSINSNNTNHNNLEYPPTNEDDTRLSFVNCHYNQQQQQQPQQPQQPPSQRMMTAPNFNNQDYTGDELVNRSIQPHNTDAMAPDWSYGDTNRYSMATTNYPNNNNNNNTWTQGDYPNWSNASSNFWPSNGHTNYSYVDQNDANAMSYYYGSRREMDYPDPSGHLDRSVKPEIGPNISSNYDFDAY